MRYEWDAAKSAANLRERGFDFAFAALVFDCVTVEDRRADYRERRIVAIGIADGVHVTVVYTDRTRDEQIVRRIISARRSNTRERTLYQEAHPS